jgi:hypothetical protein
MFNNFPANRLVQSIALKHCHSNKVEDPFKMMLFQIKTSLYSLLLKGAAAENKTID